MCPLFLVPLIKDRVQLFYNTFKVGQSRVRMICGVGENEIAFVMEYGDGRVMVHTGK